MPLPESSLSIVCTAIGDFVRTGLNAAANNIGVSLGAPGALDAEPSQHSINLFFYRFEPSGTQSLVRPDQPWRVRLFCLVTAIGIDEEEIPAGENDLRLLGEIMRLFHETPVLAGVELNGLETRLQVVFTPISDEQINQIWMTQGDTYYRPSAIFEMALAPVMPLQTYIEPPVVGAMGRQAGADMSQRHASFTGSVNAPVVPRRVVNTDNPLWQPALCWVHNGECHDTLSFDVDSPEFAAFVAQLWIAGDSTTNVTLRWDIWDREQGWRDAGSSQLAIPFSSAIEPEQVPATVPAVFPTAVTTPLPLAIPVGQTAAQGMLYATREVTIEGNTAPTVVRSNPLLLSLYRSAP